MMKRALLILALALATAACSTTRLLEEGEYRLAENKVTVVNDNNFPASDLGQYVKQKPNKNFIGRFNPFISVYNWKNGKGKAWDRFCEKLGQAPVVYDSTLVAPSAEGIVNHLEYMGYYNSQVSTKTLYKDRKAFVHYDVSLGKQYLVDSIHYEIEDKSLVDLMKADSANFTIAPGFPLSEDALENESERLSQMFRNNGYWGFSKNYFTYVADTIHFKPGVALSMLIGNHTRNENPANAKPHVQYTIGSIDIVPQNGLKVREKFINNINRLKVGDRYSEKDMQNTYNRYASIPLFSSVSMQVEEKDSSSLACSILLTPSKIQAVKLNLDGYFNSAGLFGIAPSLNYTHKNIFGGGEILDLGFKGNFQFKIKEPVRSNEFSVNASVSIPQFWLLPNTAFKNKIPRTEIKLNFNYTDRPEYKRNISSFQYGYTWDIKDNRLAFQLYPLWLNLVKATDVDPDFLEKIQHDIQLIESFITHVDIGSKFNVYYSTSNQINPDHTYFYLRGNVATSGNLLGAYNAIFAEKEPVRQHKIFGVPYDQFVRVELAAVQTWRFGTFNEYAFATRLTGGIAFAYGNSYFPPQEQTFYVGGSDSMRGWQARVLGPGSSQLLEMFIIRNQTGSMKLEANAEFRFPIVWKLKGAVFADAGNVWEVPKEEGVLDPASEFHFKTMFKTMGLDWGIGARLDFGLLLVRLDWGMKLYDPRIQSWCPPARWVGQDGYALHFGIGYPF